MNLDNSLPPIPWPDDQPAALPAHRSPGERTTTGGSLARTIGRKVLDAGKVPPPRRDAAAYYNGYCLVGAHAAVVTSADASRFTATRLLALGPLGLAFKKGAKASAALIIEGVGWSQVTPVDPKNLIYAYRQAADLNARASVAHLLIEQARNAEREQRQRRAIVAATARTDGWVPSWPE